MSDESAHESTQGDHVEGDKIVKPDAGDDQKVGDFEDDDAVDASDPDSPDPDKPTADPD